MRFCFFRLRFRFVANDAVVFPPGNPANILRGAFGSIFRRLACVPGCREARTCEIRGECAYARTFEPAALDPGPSGLADWPRPFVFRAAHLNGLTIQPGSGFEFDVNLFQVREPAIGYFVRAFSELAREGLGPGRGRATLAAVDQIAPDGSLLRPVAGNSPLEPSSVSLDPLPTPVTRLEIRFLTPTQLKSGEQLASKPEFGILMARIRDRISTLSTLYGDGPLDLDFAGFARRAALVRLTACDVGKVEDTRFSTRTGLRHPLGGFTGKAVYAGDLSEFVPFLHAASFTGVGRQTTWGKGSISVSA